MSACWQKLYTNFRRRSVHSEATLDIAYSDEHILVIEKPPGLLSQGDATGDPDVVSLMRERLRRAGGGKVPFVGLVHRLDRPASGLMVLARSSEAAAHLSEQFRARHVEKRYLVLVEGKLEGAGILSDSLAKTGRTVRVVSDDDAEGKEATLQWRSLASNDHISLLEVMLKTGRTHQIRVQIAHAGYPILGDRRYGPGKGYAPGAIALHAYSLRISHPVRRRFMTWRAEPPKIVPPGGSASAWQALLDEAGLPTARIAGPSDAHDR